MFRKTRRPLSKRERIEANNKALEHWGVMFGKPEVAAQLKTELPPKREIRRPVDNKPVGPSEHQEQSAVVSWWNAACTFYQLPPFALFAVPNGGARDAITGARLKAEGVRRGALDLILAKPNTSFAGLFIEMKAGDNQPSEYQEEFIEYLSRVGYKACVHWSADSAIAEIKNYLQPVKAVA